MTIAKAFDLQTAVYQALVVALPAVPVFAHQPEAPPERFCRIDGFTMASNEAYKNREQGDHSLTVHLIEAPAGGTLSLEWVRQASALAHAALKVLALDDHSTVLRLAAAGASLESRTDSVRDAHAFIRYITTIGE